MSLNQIIEHINEKYAYGKYGDFKVIMMTKNRYINATKLCKEYSKEFKNWLRNDNNKTLINKVEKDLNCKAIIMNQAGRYELRGTYVHELLVPHIIAWCKQPRYKCDEKDIQIKLCEQLNGQMEVNTLYGPIDILTDTEIIEVKHIKQWKQALGQILVYAIEHTDKQKRIHLFGVNATNKMLTTISQIYNKYNIALTYE
jgi:hypothetical protein